MIRGAAGVGPNSTFSSPGSASGFALIYCPGAAGHWLPLQCLCLEPDSSTAHVRSSASPSKYSAVTDVDLPKRNVPLIPAPHRLHSYLFPSPTKALALG